MANMEVDFSSCIQHNRCDYLNIYGPMNVGKTAYLDALRRYHSSLADNNSDNDDKHFTVSLDFSDFVAIAYIDAINYFRKKMSELYLLMYKDVKEELRYFETLSRYLDVIEGVSDEERLKSSLVNMVRFLRYGRRYHDYYYRPLILIDEISRPLLYADKYGYLKEMTGFYDAFLDIDHYEMTAGIVTTSYAPVNTDVHFELKYISDVPANQYEPMKAIGRNNGIELVEPHRVINYWKGDRYFDKIITLEECFDELLGEKDFSEPVLSRYEVVLSTDIRSFVDAKRKWVNNERLAYEAAEKKRREREKTEYAQPLASGFDIPSAFAGTRELDIGIGDSEEYFKLNRLLKKMRLLA